MKLLLFSLFFLVHNAFALQSLADKPLENLLQLAKKMIAQINEAKECEVVKTNGTLRFCTGFELGPDDLEFMQNLSFKGCKNFLKQVGNTVVDAKISSKPKGISKEVWDDFFSTTKLALILHDQKTILFKNAAKRGDCLHETLHFYQRNRKSYSNLSPKKRLSLRHSLQQELEKAIVVVEKLEKQGKVKKAAKIAQNLQPFISLQRQWLNMSQWFDEKEIYQAFLDFNADFSLSARDYDIALANLLRLKESLSWRLKERVIHLGNLALTEKYKRVLTPTSSQLAKLKTEKQYLKAFHRGELSREGYEENVIALRKARARLLEKTSKTLLGKLVARGRSRKFSDPIKGTSKALSIPFKIKDGFMQVLVANSWMIVDFDAQKSILPKKIFKGLKEADVALLATQVLNSTNGTTQSSPYIQIIKPLRFSVAGPVIGIKGTVADIGLVGEKGILGMDFFHSFNQGKWIVDFEKHQLLPLKKSIKGESLVKGGREVFDALEYFCHHKPSVKVRIDSGSQVLGDTHSLAVKRVAKCFSEFSFFTVMNPNNLIFSRKVDLNLGLPFLLKKVRKLSFDLQKGRVSFKWRSL